MSDAIRASAQVALGWSTQSKQAWIMRAFTAIWQRFGLSHDAASASLHAKSAAALVVRPRLGVPQNLLVHFEEAQSHSSSIRARMPMPHQLGAAVHFGVIAASPLVARHGVR